jgi:hypothetical protein
MTAVYGLRIDWQNTGSFFPGTLTGATATCAGSSTADYLVTPDADASDISVGMSAILYTSGGAIKEDRVHVVYSKPSAFGYTNLTVNPPFQSAPVSGDVLKVITPNGKDVTYRQLEQQGLHISAGRDNARNLSSVAAGQSSFSLDNSSRDYSPENTGSPLYGYVQPARPVSVYAILNGTQYSLFRGHTDDFLLRIPSKGLGSVDITVLDGLASVRGVNVTTDLYSGIRTGEAIGRVLDAVGWTGPRDLDSGATICQFWWVDNGDAGTAIEQLVNSEGAGSIVYVDGDGTFCFRDRHHRITRTASMTSQATFSNAGSDPRFSWPITYDQGWKDVINSVTIVATERQPSGVLTAVWTTDNVFTLTDGETQLITAQSNDPFLGALVPVAGTDYTVLSGAVTVTISRTRGASSLIQIKASGGPATIKGMQLRAYPILVINSTQIQVEDSTSVSSAIGRRSYTQDAPWCNRYDALAIANTVLSLRAQRLPVVTITLENFNDTLMTQILSRDLSDRITIVDSETGVNADFFIERIEHTVTGSGQRLHRTVLTCEKAVVIPATVMRFDVSGRGFDQGTFGATGVNDPTMVFRFDTASQGFDQGVFAD